MQSTHKNTSASLSGVPGVVWRRDKKRWRAQMKIDGRQRTFGSYRLFEDAVAARRAAEAQRDVVAAQEALVKASALGHRVAMPLHGHMIDRLADEIILRLIADGYVACPPEDC